MTSKPAPVDSISVRRMGSVKIQSVEISGMTRPVPPGSLVHLGTVVTPQVIVVIIRGELHVTTTNVTTCDGINVVLNKENSSVKYFRVKSTLMEIQINSNFI